MNEDKFIQHRRTRTQAMIDEAIDRAKHGQRVLVLVPTSELAKYYKSFVDEHRTTGVVWAIDFIGIASAATTIGKTWNALLVDHYVFEGPTTLTAASAIGFLRSRIVPLES